MIQAAGTFSPCAAASHRRVARTLRRCTGDETVTGGWRLPANSIRGRHDTGRRPPNAVPAGSGERGGRGTTSCVDSRSDRSRPWSRSEPNGSICSRAPCTQNTLSWCDETSEGFLNGMTSRGHTKAFDWGDGNAWEQDFRDVSLSGDDRNWADNVDFVHFSAHGGTNSSNVFRGLFGTQMGPAPGAQTRPARRQLEPRVPVHRRLQQPRAQPATSSRRGRTRSRGCTRSSPSRTWSRTRRGPPGAATGSGGGPATTKSCRTPGSTSATPSGLMTTQSRWPPGGRRPTRRTGSNNERVFSGFGDIPNNQITWFSWKWRS